MRTHRFPFSRSTMRIVDSITREQAAELVLTYSTAEEITKQAKIAYQAEVGWLQRPKSVSTWLFTSDNLNGHLYQFETSHKSHCHEIAITLSPRIPSEYRNTFQLYCLGLALSNFNESEGERYKHTGSSLDPRASQIALDMILLSEGQRALLEVPWQRVAA